MVLKRILLLALLPAIFAPPGLAQNAELDRLINSLQSKYNKLSSFSADFTQIYTGRSERSRRESGRLLLKKPGRMRWDYIDPEKKLFISDGKWLYEYVLADGYAVKNAVKESDDFRAPFMFLLGRGNLRRDFRKIEFSSESPARAGNRVLRMIPKRSTGFRELLVEVEPVGLALSRLSIIDGDGSRSDFLFSNIRENAQASDSQFSLPAGVEIR